ncbi:biological adhesion [Branchiostoma belcheri]|nr:biological adhesion [Branchiostoma belcheri]
MRKAAIITYAVGIGSNLDRDQLDVIAGVPENLMMLDNFSMLDNLRTTLPGRVCAGATSEQILIRILITSTRFDVSLLNANSTAFQTILYKSTQPSLATSLESRIHRTSGVSSTWVSKKKLASQSIQVYFKTTGVASVCLQHRKIWFTDAPAQLNNLTIDNDIHKCRSCTHQNTIIVTVELTLNYTEDYQYTSSTAYVDLGVTIEDAVLQAFTTTPADVQTTATSTSVTVSVVALGANVDATTRIIVNTTAPGTQLGNLPVLSATVGDTTPPCSAVADIVFVVDGTGSVGLENFERMKTFISQLLAFLDIGENAVRVSIVQYAVQARTEFFLDQYFDLQALQDAVEAIQYMGGYTKTGNAIDFATNVHFDVRNGARATVTKIVVVITDGISQDDVQRPARRMRQAGIVTIAVGVGSNLDSDQLLAIAGDPNTRLSLDDFDRLQDLTTTLPSMLCDVGTSQQIVVSICVTTTYDVLILNANSSVSTALFQQVVQGLTTTVTSSPGIAALQPIGFAPGCGGVVSTVQCAVAPFALDTVQTTFQNLQPDFGDLTIDPGQTTVVSADTRTTIIVTVELTLNYTEDYQDTSSTAYVDLGVTIEDAVLQAFTTTPADVQSVSITSVAPGTTATSTSVTVSVVALGANVDATTRIIVNTTAPGTQLGNLPVLSATVGDTTPPCSAVADIVFVVDGTGSVGLENFERMKTFISQLLAFLDIGENAVRVSIVQYAVQARTEFFLDQYFDLQALQDAVEAIQYMGGYTKTGNAIDFATNVHFDVRNGARATVTKIVVVITDGISQDDVQRPARRMRQAGIVTIAVGVGSNLDSDQLLAIAGDPNTRLSLDDFDRLQDLTTTLPSMLCDVGTSQQIVVSICVTTTYDVLFSTPIPVFPRHFSNKLFRGCGGVVSTVQCAVAPFALDTVQTTFQNLQPDFGDLTIDPGQTTVVSADTRTTIIVTVELTLNYTEDYQDTSSTAYVDLGVTIEDAVLQAFTTTPADVQSVSITSVAPGTTATSTSVTVSVVALGANVDATTRIIVNTTAPGTQLGNLPVLSATVGDTTPPCSAVADIVFVVDGTGSVGLENFERMKTFISQLLAFLDIGENAVRVSIVQYAVQARTEFFLDQYFDLQALQDAVEAIQYMGGYTKTGNAIDFATNVHFDVRNGARATVTKIVVVITDGISQDDVQRPARRMRQAGIVTIAVGVGSNLDSDQLLAIAGDPNTRLSLDDFDRLQDLTTTLPSMLCDVGTSQQIVVSICVTTTYDVLILNANSSVSTALFQQVVQGLTTTVTSSPGIAALQPIGFAPGCGGVVSTVQCAVAPFALDTVQTTFQNLQPDFGDLTIDPGQTTVVSADTRTTIIVTVELTLNYTEDYQDTSSTAYVDLGVTIEDAVLQAFTTTPADVQSVSITSVASGTTATRTSVTVSVVALGANVDATTQIIINTTTPGTQLGNLPVVSSSVGDSTPPCSAVLDLLFVLDGTGSVGEENFERIKAIVQKIVTNFNIGAGQTRVGIIQYANIQRMEISLDAYSDVDSLVEAIGNIGYIGGNTLTGQALDYTRKFGFSPNNGARTGVVQVAIVITDGVSDDEVSNPAQRMRKAQIVTYAVGIGSNLDNDQLLSIAGTAGNVVMLSDFNRLTDLATTLPQQVCEVGRGVQLFIGLSVPSVTFDDNLLNADSSAYVTLVQQVNSGNDPQT